MKNVLFGLTYESSNEEIREMVFKNADEARYFSMATIPAVGHTPGARILDFMESEDDGMIYFGVGTGKHCNKDIEKNPIVSLSGSFVGEDISESEHRMLIGFRISGTVRKAENPKAIEEYWLRNPGSKLMWEKNMDSFIIYCIYKGDGELYQVYKNDKIYRLRFGFGGEDPRPYHYQINQENCIGCGDCERACTANIIEMKNNKAHIPYHHCYECGVCLQTCSHGAVDKYNNGG